MASFLFLICCALTIVIFGASVNICNKEVSSIRFGLLVKIGHKNDLKIYQGDGNASDGE